MSDIPEGHMWLDDDGGVLHMHFWHRWFAWRPVWLTDAGWVWMRTIERRFSTKSTPSRLSVVAHYRLASSGQNLADAHSKNPPPQKEQQHEP